MRRSAVLWSVAVLGFAPAGAQAAARHAAPSGAGTACTADVPCSLAEAITGATNGDEVIVAPGDYGTPASPLASSIQSTASLDVHGEDPANRPRIVFDTHALSANGLVLTGNGVALRDLEVRNVSTAAGAQAVFASGTTDTIDRVVVRTDGTTNFSTNETSVALVANASSAISNVIAWATASNVDSTHIGAEAIQVQGSGATAGGLRNATLVAGTSGLAALDLSGLNGTSTATVVNTLVVGTTVVRASSGSMTASFDHDILRNNPAPLSGGAIAPGSNWTIGTPVFTDAPNGDFHQHASSPTVDAGTTSGLATDIDGDVRTIGVAPDVGADELPSAPSAALTSVDQITASSAVVHGTVDTGGGGASFAAEFSTDALFGQHADGTSSLARAIGAQAVSVPLTGLAPATLYHVRLRATNARGAATSAESTFTTAPGPTATPTPTPSPTPTATPTASPTPTPTAAQNQVTLLSKRASVSRSGAFRLVFANASALAVRLSAGVARLTRTGHGTLAAHAQGSLRLRLTRQGSRRLRHAKHHRLKVRVTVTVTAPSGRRTFAGTVLLRQRR